MQNQSKATDVTEITSSSAQEGIGQPTAVGGNGNQEGQGRRSKRRMYTRKIAITGVFTALAYGLYLLGKFCKLPFMFPSFFDLQFSELPALIAGFVLGPLYGAAVVVLKCLLKMPMSSTALVGEATDIILGLALVVPASLIYRRNRSIKGALWGVIVGSLFNVVAAVLVNRFISIPFYLQMFFKGNKGALLGMMRPLFPNITWDNFFTYYLLLSVVPFNLLRCIIMCVLTFAVYKRLSRMIKRWVGESSASGKNAPKLAEEGNANGNSPKGAADVLCRRYVPTMWSVLILLSVLVVAVVVGVWLCLK